MKGIVVSVFLVAAPLVGTAHAALVEASASAGVGSTEDLAIGLPTSAQASVSIPDGHAFARASIASASVQASARYRSPTLSNARAVGWFTDILEFEIDTGGWAFVDAITHMSATISGPGGFETRWNLYRCTDSSCSGFDVTSGIFEIGFFESVNRDFVTPVRIDDGAFYLLSMSATARATVEFVGDEPVPIFGTVNALNTTAFDFDLPDGVTFTSASGVFNSAPVTPVPVPAAAWLFVSAIFGAGVMGRRNKK